MNQEPDDTYQKWLHKKRGTEVPERFADQVMSRLGETKTTERLEPWWLDLGFWTKAALLTFAFLGGVGRYGIAAFIIFFS